MKIAAAISPCPNDVFIFSGIMGGAVRPPGLEFSFAFHDVETLNRDAQAGVWDLVKISYANFPRVDTGYRLLDCGGALGRGCGPLLLSNSAGAGLWDRPSAAARPEEPLEVLVPGEFTTANFLLDFFHVDPAGAGFPDRARKLAKTYLPFDTLYRRLLGPEPCVGVVIHEMRFTYAADGLNLIQDLGAHWEKRTGHPIPLGACALRRRLDGAAEDITRAVRASLDWAYAHEAEALELCRRHSQSMNEAVLRSHIDLYVNGFSRDLGAQGREAVEFFLSRLKGFKGPMFDKG